MKLTEAERAILLNQFRILEVLKPSESDSFAASRLAIERGYEEEYAKVLGIGAETVPEDVTREVHTIMWMFRVITLAREAVPDLSPEVTAKLRFRGFDSNNELDQYSYLQYCRERGEWTSIDTETLASAYPMLHHYRKMLSAFNSIARTPADRFELTKEDLETIAGV